MDTKISINQNLNFIDSKDECNKRSAYGWETTSLSMSDNFRRQNHILTGLLQSGHRSDSNLVGFQSIMLDFDKFELYDANDVEQIYIDKIKALPFKAYVFGSTNHRKFNDKARLRVFIPVLEETYNTSHEIKTLYAHIVRTVHQRLFSEYIIDEKSFSASQYFFKSDSEFYYENEAPALFSINSLLEQYPVVVPKKSTAATKSLYTDEKYFSENDDIKLGDDRTIVKISSLPKDESVKNTCFCLCCDVTKRTKGQASTHNATIHWRNGLYSIYCSSKNRVTIQNPAEVELHKIPAYRGLFFDLNTSCVALAKESVSLFEKPLHYFLNQIDWKSFCIDRSIETDIQLFLPRARSTFNPGKNWGLDLDAQEFNTYVEPTVLKDARNNVGLYKETHTITNMKNVVPLTNAIFENLFGTGDEKRMMLDWLSKTLHTNQKNFTCPIITTRNGGAGKGLLSEIIIAGIFGYTAIEDNTALNTNFNSFEASNRFIIYNELFVDQKNAQSRKELLKAKIGATVSTITLKGVDSFKAPSITNFMILSNNDTPFHIDTTMNNERRFIVINNPHAKRLDTDVELFRNLVASHKDIGEEVKRELVDFARILLLNTDLKYYDININAPLTNAKVALIESSKDFVEDIVTLLIDKNWEEIADVLNIPTQKPSPFSNEPDRDEFLAECKAYEGLPSIYMSKLLTTLGGNYANSNSSRKKLKSLGIVNKGVKKHSIVKKVFRYE